MTDPLNAIWTCLDAPEPVFPHAVVSLWPIAIREWLISNRILRETIAASHIACPCCHDGHMEEVLVAPGSTPTRHFIPCPESLRVQIDPGDLRRWALDVDALATVIAAALNLRGRPKAIAPGRLWRLGTTAWRDASREVLLARRLHADDRASVGAHVGREGRPIVLVPARQPPQDAWPGRPPACVLLEQIITFEDSGPAVDALLLHDLVSEADRLREQIEVVPLNPKAKKLTVRRQVKAEIKGHLNDDVLIAARLTHGSVRKAAKALTDQLGRPVTKDQIQRAIDRCGGLDAIAETDDSASVPRRVASQRRDRQKNFAERR